jgi:hypothetical protein
MPYKESKQSATGDVRWFAGFFGGSHRVADSGEGRAPEVSGDGGGRERAKAVAGEPLLRPPCIVSCG